MWRYLWCWAKRRHPNKNTKWVRKRYFHTIDGAKWTFACQSEKRGKEVILVLYPVNKTTIERHVKVKGDASPDDPSLREYWDKRHQKQGKSYWEKNSRNYRIAPNHSWKCPVCGQPLFNGEEIETHHSRTCGSRWTERHQQPTAPAQTVPQAGTLKNQAKSLEVRLEPDDAKVSSPVLRGGAPE